MIDRKIFVSLETENMIYDRTGAEPMVTFELGFSQFYDTLMLQCTPLARLKKEKKCGLNQEKKRYWHAHFKKTKRRKQ